MLKVTAQQYITLGREMYHCEEIYRAHDGEPLVDSSLVALRFHLASMLGMCQEIGLTTSIALLSTRVKRPPKTGGEFEVLVDAIWAELKDNLFLFVPSHRSKYYDLTLPSIVITRFPSASRELVLSGNCIAAGLSTASVFHSMRAVELGLQAMATALGVTFPYPIALAGWGQIVEAIEPEINKLKAGPRSTQKDEDLKFYSEAASQFRHFNNGWRVRNAHPREHYDDDQAIKVFDHSHDFFRTLSERLKE